MKKKNAQILKDIVDKWYDKAASLTLNPPDRVTVIQSVLAKVTDEEAEVIARMSRPIFLIRNCHVMHEVENSYMNGFYKEALESELYAKTSLGNTYEWCVTEGGNPVTGGNQEDYISNAERLLYGELSNITPTFYLLLQKLLRDEVDEETYTLTSYEKGGAVAYGDWNRDRARFNYVDLDAQRVLARLRASVMGELTFDPKTPLEISCPPATIEDEKHKAILAWLDEYHMAFRDAKRWRIELEKFLDKLFNI